jgi:hypothetical protein
LGEEGFGPLAGALLGFMQPLFAAAAGQAIVAALGLEPQAFQHEAFRAQHPFEHDAQ